MKQYERMYISKKYNNYDDIRLQNIQTKKFSFSLFVHLKTKRFLQFRRKKYTQKTKWII